MQVNSVSLTTIAVLTGICMCWFVTYKAHRLWPKNEHKRIKALARGHGYAIFSYIFWGVANICLWYSHYLIFGVLVLISWWLFFYGLKRMEEV